MPQPNQIEPNEPQKDEVSLLISGELDPSDYIHSIPFNIEKQQEETRSRIAQRLITMFGATLVTTYIFVGAAAFNPNADKAFIKDITSQVIPPQLVLLGAALGYYFGSKKN
jgi:FtsH-binding integral membrane protein